MTNKVNKILIITGGQVDELFLSNHLLQEQYTMIIAADRGLTVADRLNLPLDFIVGDFDSVSKAVLNKYRELSTPIQTFPTEKDKTDTQIAIELAIMQNASDIDIIGATGSRLDHVLANIHLLMLPLQLKIKARLIDPNNKIYLKNESFSLMKYNQFGDFVSLLPFSEKVHGLTLKGFKYPLNNITLTAGNSLGISNEIKAEEAFVEFTDGILIVIESRE
ncbi:MAG: thiamine diphosphokinase [Mobilitalea sp.]